MIGEINPRSAIQVPETERYLCTCGRCGYKWISVRGMPARCASHECNSPYWNRNRVRGVNKSKGLKPERSNS